MIQQHRYGTGLNKYISQIQFKDISNTSENYFRILDAPDKLYVGKTSFRIRLNLDTLVQGSTIYIDVIDSAGNTIYHEIADIIGKDKSRIVVIYVYENTAPGEATLYVAGRTKYRSDNGQYLEYNDNPESWDYKHYPNIMWSKKMVVIPSTQTPDEILFTQSPEVTCHERTEYFSTAPVSERRKVSLNTNTGSLFLQSTVTPYQYSNTSKYSTTYNEDGKFIDLDPSGSSDFIKSQQIQVPSYFGFNTIRSNDFEFNKDYVGGKLIIKNPNNLDTTYSASILRIIDRNTVEVDAPFSFNDGTQQITKITDASNFTASYISRDVNLTTYETESFVQFDFKNLEPTAGVVDRIRISYKPYGSFGEFIGVGDFPVLEQNFLIDSASLLPDKISIIEQPIGDLSGSYSYGQYWNFISNPNTPIYTEIQDAISFDRGGKLFYTASTAVTSSEVDYISYLKLKEDYSIRAVSNSEFKLQISTRYTEQDTYTNIHNDRDIQQIDVYISGSSVITDELHTNRLQPLLKTKSFGTYVGSITTQKGNTQLDSKFYFKIIEDGNITPIFVVRSGIGWEFKEISLTPRKELGYSPNQCKLMVPINTLKTNMELVLKLEYLSPSGKKADVETILYGLNFIGSGFPKDRLFTNTGIVSSSQQINTGSFTGSFNGEFFGIPTGSPTIQYYRTHTQDTASMTWSFGHGLSWQYPVVTVWNESGEVMIPERIFAESVYVTKIYFPIAKSGHAVATVGSIMPTGALHYDNLLGKPTLISSSGQIASDISGSWTIVSSSLELNKINRQGDNAVSSSTQINIFSVLSSSHHQVNELYAPFSSSQQNLSIIPTPLWWTNSPVIFNPDSNVLISGSYFKMSTPGVYEINSMIYIDGTDIVQIKLGVDPKGTGALTEYTLYSASAVGNRIIINYWVETTGSNDRVVLIGETEGTAYIPAETPLRHSYYKVTRIKTS